MTKRKRGLGRGLDALLTSSRAAAVATQEDSAAPLADAEPVNSGAARDGELRHLPVEWLQPGTAMAEALPLHTVVPYRNIPKKYYPTNIPKESAP